MKKSLSLIGTAALGTAGLLGLTVGPASAAPGGPAENQVCVVVNDQLPTMASAVADALSRATETAGELESATEARDAALVEFVVKASVVVTSSDSESDTLEADFEAMGAASDAFATTVVEWSTSNVAAYTAHVNHDRAALAHRAFSLLQENLDCEGAVLVSNTEDLAHTG